jgi:hypothetical protein
MVPDIGRMSMPVNLQTQIHWFQSSLQFTTALNATTITEFNFPFTLGDLAGPLSSSISILFDQYAIFAVNLRYILNFSAPVTSASPTYTTAIDYDNVGLLGNIILIRAFSTAVTSSVADVQERYIEPCNAPALYSGTGGLFSNYGTARMWVDSANISTPHYGSRCIVSPLGAGTTGTLSVECTYVFCARNVV